MDARPGLVAASLARGLPAIREMERRTVLDALAGLPLGFSYR
jgi:hypothetical protein